jgi:hypothetical protein
MQRNLLVGIGTSQADSPMSASTGGFRAGYP